jgi:ribonuclease P protein component
MGRFSFGKDEKLCSKLMIDELFRSGKSFKEFPIRVIHLQKDTGIAPAQLLISVPKKKFRKAVSRNRVKRLIRETYRLNKPELIDKWKANGKYFALAFVYIGNDIPTYQDLDAVMKRIMDKLNQLSV